LQSIGTIYIRQPQIEYNDVGGALDGPLHPFHGRGRGLHIVAAFGQPRGQRLADPLIIFYEKN
jgi:hypothetical protein